MHSTSLHGLKLSVLRGMGAKALATDHRDSLLFKGLYKIQRRGRQRERKKKKQLRFNKQNNNFAGASHFFVHFFAPFAVLHHYDAKIEICSWLAYVYRVMGARGKFGEHDKNA